jgi:hypothetical protein
MQPSSQAPVQPSSRAKQPNTSAKQQRSI